MVTKDGQDKLRKQRPTPGASLTYTPGGNTEERVHMTTHAQLTGQINKGDRLLSTAVQNFRDNLTFKSLEGRSRGAFLANAAPKLTPRSLADRNHQERER